jgi:DNA-binding protein H-NS
VKIKFQLKNFWKKYDRNGNWQIWRGVGRSKAVLHEGSLKKQTLAWGY